MTLASSVFSDVFLLQLMYMLLIECGVINYSYLILILQVKASMGRSIPVSVLTLESWWLWRKWVLCIQESLLPLVFFSERNVHDLAGIEDFWTVVSYYCERMGRQIAYSCSHICCSSLSCLSFFFSVYNFWFKCM